MGREPRPDLEELGLKSLLVIDELLTLFQGVSRRLKTDRRGLPGGSLRGRESARADGSPSPGDLAAELAELRRRIEALEAAHPALRRDAGAAPADPGSPVSGPGSDRGSSKGRRTPSSRPGAPPARLDRDTSRARALSAARQLRQEGKAVTLASVARAAGLKYSQVVYAFRRRADLLRQLEGQGADD